MSLDNTAFAAALKVHYSDEARARMGNLKAKLDGLVRRKTDAGGESYTQPLDVDLPTGGSATIGKAISNYVPSDYDKWVASYALNYEIPLISRLTIAQSNTSKNAFWKAIGETDRAMKAALHQRAARVYRTSGGSIGKLDSTTNVATAVGILTRASDAYLFAKGMKNTFAAADGTGSERNSSGILSVTSIDRQQGKITYGANINTNTGTVAGDYIFREGDFGLCASGLMDYIPVENRATSAALHGISAATRLTDVDRYMGIAFAQAGDPLNQVLIKLVQRAGEAGGDTSHVFCNTRTYGDVLTLLDGRVRYENVTVKNQAGIGFTGVKIHGTEGDVMMFSDIYCPEDQIWALQLDTYLEACVGVCPMFLDLDGLFARSSTADAYEARVGNHHQYIMRAPSWNAVCVLNQTSLA